MKYQLREGVILTELCRQPMLVATGKALESCSYMSLVNQDAAFYLKRLKTPVTPDSLAEAAAAEYGESAEKMGPIAENFLASLVKKGYVVQVSEDA